MQKDINIQFGSRLRALRNSRGWTQEMIAEKAQLNRNYISLIETGKKSPTLNTIKQICDALDMPVSDFFVNCGL